MNCCRAVSTHLSRRWHAHVAVEDAGIVVAVAARTRVPEEDPGHVPFVVFPPMRESATSRVGSGSMSDVGGLAGAPPTGNSRPGPIMKKRSSDVSERTTFPLSRSGRPSRLPHSSANPQVWAAELPAVTTRPRSCCWTIPAPRFLGWILLSWVLRPRVLDPAPSQTTRHMAITVSETATFLPPFDVRGVCVVREAPAAKIPSIPCLHRPPSPDTPKARDVMRDRCRRCYLLLLCPDVASELRERATRTERNWPAGLSAEASCASECAGSLGPKPPDQAMTRARRASEPHERSATCLGAFPRRRVARVSVPGSGRSPQIEL